MRRAWHTAIARLASSARVNGPALTYWVLGHFPITLSIVAAGAATVSLIEHAHDARAPEGTAWLLAGAVALGLLAMIVIERSLVDAEHLVSVYRALGMVLPVGAVGALVVGWVRPAPWLLAIYVAIRSGGENIWASLLEGIVGIAAGLIAFFWPASAALALVFVVATWAIATGVLEVFAAMRLRKVITNEWTLIVSGVLSLVFGILLLIEPAAGALTLVLLTGLYAVMFGVDMLALAWRLRSVWEQMRGSSASVPQTQSSVA